MEMSINSSERNVILACVYTYEKELQHAMKAKNQYLEGNSSIVNELQIVAQIKQKLNQEVLA